MAIQFFFTGTVITLLKRNKLKEFIKQQVANEKKKISTLVIIFCTDEYLLKINKQFLQHDFYTDIITFNLAEKRNTIEGEIYISVDRVRENAKINSVSQKNELHRVIFHGILHLCGHFDKSASEKKIMTSLENAFLIKYFS